MPNSSDVSEGGGSSAAMMGGFSSTVKGSGSGTGSGAASASGEGVESHELVSKDKESSEAGVSSDEDESAGVSSVDAAEPPEPDDSGAADLISTKLSIQFLVSELAARVSSE